MLHKKLGAILSSNNGYRTPEKETLLDMHSLRSLAIIIVFLLSSKDLFAKELIDLKLGSADIRLETHQPGMFSSIQYLTSGDINGDGKDDIAVTGEYGGPLVKDSTSVVFIYFGRSLQKHEKPIVIRQTHPDVAIFTRWKPTFGPRPLWIADVNGDQYGDLLLGVMDGLSILFGGKKWLSQIDLRERPPDLHILTKKRTEAGQTWSGTISAGNLNGDGIDDFIFSLHVPPDTLGSTWRQDRETPTQRQELGWVFFGKKSWAKHINLAKEKPDSTIWGEQPAPEPRHTRPFRIADLDGDGFGDIIVGAWGGSEGRAGLGDMRGPWGSWKTGWLIPGKLDFPAEVELTEKETIFDEENKKYLLHIDPRPYGMYIEAGLAVGDFTGDKIEDLIFGMVAKRVDYFYPRRRFCLISGDRNFFLKKEFDTQKTCVLLGGEADIESIGISGFVPLPIIGDYDGNGVHDFFFMTRSRTQLGLFWKKPEGRTLDLKTAWDVKILPPELRQGGYGFTTKMGDFNGDGLDDVLILSALENGGTVYIILGKNNLRDSEKMQKP